MSEESKEILINLLQTKFKTAEFSLYPIFSAKKHGFTAEAFHSKCDGKGANIVIIENTNGNIFGGFTSISWSSDSKYHSDRNAFLFVIKNGSSMNGEICELKTSDDDGSIEHAVLHAEGRGPVFGEAIHALSISNQCKIAPKSFTNDNSSYVFYGNELCGGNDMHNSQYYFKVVNYEVFQVIGIH